MATALRRLRDLEAARWRAQQEIEFARLGAQRDQALSVAAANAVPQFLSTAVGGVERGANWLDQRALQNAQLDVQKRAGDLGPLLEGPLPEGETSRLYADTPAALAAKEAAALEPSRNPLLSLFDDRRASAYQAGRAEQLNQGRIAEDARRSAREDRRIAQGFQREGIEERRRATALKSKADAEERVRELLKNSVEADLAFGESKTSALVEELAARSDLQAYGVDRAWMQNTIAGMQGKHELGLQKEERAHKAHKDALVTAAEAQAGKTTQKEREEIAQVDSAMQDIDDAIELIDRENQRGLVGPLVGLATGRTFIADVLEAYAGTETASLAQKLQALSQRVKTDFNDGRLTDADAKFLESLEMNTSRPAESMRRWLLEYKKRLKSKGTYLVGGRKIPGRAEPTSTTAEKPAPAKSPTATGLEKFGAVPITR